MVSVVPTADVNQFYRRLSRVYESWDELIKVDSIVVPVGQNDNSEHTRSTTFQDWLFNLEIPDILMVFSKNIIYFLATKKKIDFLKPLQDKAPSNGKVPKIELLIREKTNSNKNNFAEILSTLKLNKTIGVFAEDKFPGDFYEECIEQIFNSDNDFEELDISPAIGCILEVKEEAELQLISKASNATELTHSRVLCKELTEANIYIHGLLAIVILYLFANFILSSMMERPRDKSGVGNDEIGINLQFVDGLDRQFPGLLSAKEMRTIKSRLSVMRREVSILMLLGKARDNHCKLDPTFCVGQTIANATQVQFGYIDASDPNLHPRQLEQELHDSLERSRGIRIDSLEKLPGTQVMNLFQYIDKDEADRRRGMLLFVVYTGVDFERESPRLKEADIAEKILVDRWSPFVPKDSLSSVISRLCGSIVKVY